MEGLSPNYDFDSVFGLLCTFSLSFCSFGRSIKVFITQNPASWNTNTGKANQATFSGSRGVVPGAELNQVQYNNSFSISVTLSAKTLPIRSQPMAEPVAGPSRALSLSEVCTREVIPRAPGPRGEHRAKRAEERTSIEGSRPGAEVPGLTQANLQRLKGKDPKAAALASVVSSLPLSKTSPTPELEKKKVANAQVKAWRRASRRGKGKETAMRGPMFGTTWGEEFEIPYGECAASASARSSEWELDWISGEPTHTKEPVCMEREPSLPGVSPEPVCVERGLPPRMAAPKLVLDETMELLSRDLGAGE